MPYVIIFDIDGTLAEVTHRLHFIKWEKKDYKAFFDWMVDDGVIGIVADVASFLKCDYDIVLITGRPESHREETDKRLRNNSISYSALYMREAGDHRPDYEVKKEIYEREIKWKRNVACVFEDRGRVVKMRREQGLYVFDCNQSGEDF